MGLCRPEAGFEEGSCHLVRSFRRSYSSSPSKSSVSMMTGFGIETIHSSLETSRPGKAFP